MNITLGYSVAWPKRSPKQQTRINIQQMLSSTF
ncbi:MAG: hypothetical protein ACJA01_003260, partial [Saprospiraceae bacterium]